MNPDEDIRDIAGTVEISVIEPWMIIAVALLGLLLLAALIWLGIRLNRARRKRAIITARDHALRELESLRREMKSMTGYDFGVSVSDILRHYITHAKRLRASSQTSQEFLSECDQAGHFSEKNRERLRVFLESCDRLKYTPAGRAEEPNRELWEQANFFVRDDLS